MSVSLGQSAKNTANGRRTHPTDGRTYAAEYESIGDSVVLLGAEFRMTPLLIAYGGLNYCHGLVVVLEFAPVHDTNFNANARSVSPAMSSTCITGPGSWSENDAWAAESGPPSR